LSARGDCLPKRYAADALRRGKPHVPEETTRLDAKSPFPAWDAEWSDGEACDLPGR